VLLAALGGGARAAVAPTRAGFDHFYAVMDEATVRAIETSEYLREFADVEVKTTNSSAGHYRGLYLNGRETSVELFAPAGYDLDAPPAPVGKLGLAVSTEQVGGVTQLQTAMADEGAPAEVSTVRATLAGRTVDWFLSLTPLAPAPPTAPGQPSVEIWAMEYLESYFDAARKEPPEGDRDRISRERYRRDDYRQHMMRDVTGLTMAVTAEDWAGLRPLLSAAGMAISEGDGEAQASANARLRFIFVPRRLVGLRQLEFALNSAPASMRIEQLGRSRLTVGPGAYAVWTFGPRPARVP
jgi:hypothetical protein